MHPPDPPNWRKGLQAPALGLIAGLMHAASLTWPFSLPARLLTLLNLHPGQPVWWLELLSLGMLAYLLLGCRNWRAAALLGWTFGLAWLAATVSWTFVAMHTYGGLPVLLALMAVFVLTSLMALFYAGACGLFVALRPRRRGWIAPAFAALWLLAELARGTWLTGFGWGASAYAHTDGPLAGYAPWLGVYGLCAIGAWLAMTLAQLWRSRSRRDQARSLGVSVFLLGLPFVLSWAIPSFSTSTGRLGVTLLQGNVAQDDKFEVASGVPMALQWYGEQMQRSRTALVVAPETAIALLPQQLPPGYLEMLQDRFDHGQQAALVGIPLGDYQKGYTNSVMGLKPDQTQVWRYDKQHLVPFGEFIPPFFKWFTAMMNIPLGDFKRGGARQPPLAWEGQRLAANICYEDLFGEELALQFADLELMPTIFVNISNLAWFGNGLAMDQHLQIARMRSLEFERAFVLATNTGATAIVDHRAHILSTLARDTRAVLVGDVEGRTGITPYAWWVARFGLWPLWLLALALLWLAARDRWTKH
jgi:apolipoprotein N-acyltransferase